MVKQDAFKRGIKIERKIAEEFRRQNVWVDGVKIKQIVIILLDNAIKFTPLGGEIKLEAQTADHEIMISVYDTGIGIKPEDHERIFKEFEQVDSSRSRREQGTGLGLALARRLVELHGGCMSVQSEGDNKGSVFTFVIPLVPACDEYGESNWEIVGPERPSQSSQAHICPPKSNRPSILVVEDNSTNMKLVTNLLEADGYSTLQAFSSEEAFNILKTQTPDLILMDISLPGVDGLMATKVIKNDPATSHVPVVALTAHAMGDNKATALEVGCDAYILKPIDTRIFYSTLSGLINSNGVGAVA
jgi:CheY-like chemotaxis protein/anti-sigma regulatory factor (Ser/Thr protein kinase)